MTFLDNARPLLLPHFQEAEERIKARTEEGEHNSNSVLGGGPIKRKKNE